MRKTYRELYQFYNYDPINDRLIEVDSFKPRLSEAKRFLKQYQVVGLNSSRKSLEDGFLNLIHDQLNFQEWVRNASKLSGSGLNQLKGKSWNQDNINDAYYIMKETSLKMVAWAKQKNSNIDWSKVFFYYSVLVFLGIKNSKSKENRKEVLYGFCL